MFIAMNRFQVVRGKEDEFETVWRTRESYLESVPGFVEFHLLKGPESEDHTLYASHSVWQSRSAFEDWTRSEAFRAAHGRAGNAATERGGDESGCAAAAPDGHSMQYIFRSRRSQTTP